VQLENSICYLCSSVSLAPKLGDHQRPFDKMILCLMDVSLHFRLLKQYTIIVQWSTC